MDLVHLIDPAVTFHATNSPGDMHRMVKINVVRSDVNLDPGNRGIIGRAFADDGQARIIFQDLIMAIHAGRSGRDIGHPGFIHVAVTITAIEAELTGVDFVGKWHRLNRLITDTVIFRCDINGHAYGRGPSDQRGANA